MQLKGIVPDEHTLVALLKATSKIGDTQTAYDALQDIKIHGLKMTEHVYNGLIRTYAGAAAQRHVKESHIDMYINDAFELFNQAKDDPEITINIHILNSMLFLHTQALRIEDLDANVLPLYEKHKIKHDVYTY